jgi:hypothetical protein
MNDKPMRGELAGKEAADPETFEEFNAADISCHE